MILHTFQKTGRIHQQNGLPSQDAVLFRDFGHWAAAAVADGVSSCRCAQIGAEIACFAAVDFLNREQERIRTFSSAQLCYLLKEHVLYHLEKESGKTGNPLEAYSSTLTVLFWDKEQNLVYLFQLGDGAILSRQGESWRVCLFPQTFSGRPCTTTTAYAEQLTQLKKCTFSEGDAVLLCTDGVWNTGNLPNCPQEIDAYITHADPIDDASYLYIEYERREPWNVSH